MRADTGYLGWKIMVIRAISAMKLWDPNAVDPSKSVSTKPVNTFFLPQRHGVETAFLLHTDGYSDGPVTALPQNTGTHADTLNYI